MSVQRLGITLPKELVKSIDDIRKDIPRSRYIRRIIEVHLQSADEVN